MGENKNDKNALVTVLRHEWSASAHQGQIGSLPRSVLLLDFAIFERYFYLCNVATEITEPLLTQAPVVNYLFYVRQEAEEQFLSFVPEINRDQIRNELQLNLITKKFFKPSFNLTYNSNMNSISIDSSAPYQSFIKNLLSTKFAPDVVGSKSLVIKNPMHTLKPMSSSALKSVSTIPFFSSHMPNVSYLLVLDGNTIQPFSLLPNRYFKSRSKLSLINNYKYEKSVRAPNRDVMEVYEGIEANYPEKIYIVTADNLPGFINSMTSIKSRQDFIKFNQEFGLNQMSKDFWKYIDWINQYNITENPITGGIMDLHKYGSIDAAPPL